ncbi:Signal transduction histidine kinase [Lachnospiraceae bacterium NE2001]|nr:Signal transduction histidine kinase [Lachnospiraceae bacterium NE2001]
MRLRNKSILIFGLIMVCLSAYLFGVINSNADDISTGYKQTLYNQDNGLGSSEVNCIYQSKSGYIWVGTDGGLYRYNGNEFRLFNLWNTDKADVYYINSLFQDSKGSLWVSTNNYGLFRISGSDIYHFSDEYYKGVKCVNSVCEAQDGTIYVATAYGVYTVSPDGANLVRNEELAKHNVKGITASENRIYGIYNGNTIFSIDENNNIVEVLSTDYTTEEVSTISYFDGVVYIGTTGNDVLNFSNIRNIKTWYSTRDGINSIYKYGKRIYICADSGIGYFHDGDAFTEINNIAADNYISDMIIDYEGNFWIASSKTGLVFLSKSKFSNLNKKYNVASGLTNCVSVFDGYTYIGTDEGLYILDSENSTVINELTDYLNGVSIRDIIRDKNGNIWLATYRRYGIVKYAPNGNITSYNKASGLLSNMINSIYELNNGNIAIGTEDGISIINKSGVVIQSYTYENGLESTNIISLYQNEDGLIYAGSDGGGLYTIDGDEISNYTDDDGLNSNVVSAITKADNGLWIGTNNGLAYYDGTFRAISNIDFSNNIYSIIKDDDKYYIVGSKGLIYATEDELLSTAPLSERYYSVGDGLGSSISINSKNFIYSNVVYLCTAEGVMTYDLSNIQINDVPPKVTISEVDVDGHKYYYDELEGGLDIPSDTQRLEISFAVLSYTNRENIQVKYQLVGFDNEPEILTTTDNFQAIYTNLDGGVYNFELSAVNGDGISSDVPISFTINKEKGFFERQEVRIGLVALILLNILAIVYIIFRLWKNFIGKNRELNALVKKHEDVIKDNTAKTDYLANMSNEIKLPINAMISSANSMLKESEADVETQEKLMEIIDKGHDVIGKVDETILLARLESGSEQPVNEPYSVTTLICDISDGMINKLSEQPIKFLVDLGDNIPDILVGDFDKIKTVLEILLDNSIKYTKEGTITLSIDYYELSGNESSNSRLICSVSDTGIGISEERLEHIFEIYYVDESKMTGTSTGKGVSMSIAKKLADILGGELEVESTYGAGATFTFSVEQSKPETTGSVIPLNDNTVERVSREEAERMWAPDLSILLVDDQPLSRQVAVDVIKSMEIKCDTAESGVGAIDMVMTNRYDMVLMDIAMPVMNGIDALREIRDLSDDFYRELPVIAMSEDVIGKNRQDIIDEGFSDVILKPFDITVLASLINRFADKEKIKYKTNDAAQYISESRYGEGLKTLEDYLDVVGVLDRIGGNIEVYNKILSTFYNQNKDAKEELRAKFNTDYRGFRNKIHSIRTGCQNIGAADAAEISLRIENALNLGNKTYVESNIGLVYDCLAVINDLIENYLAFVDDNKGVTDKEYAEKLSKTRETEELKSEEQRSEGPVIIDIAKLRAMKAALFAEDMDHVRIILDDISTKQYGTEDQEFISALRDTVEGGDFIEIDDLLNTYIDLKENI